MRLTVGALSLALLVAIAFQVTRSTERRTVSNPITNLGGQVYLPEAALVCQKNETVGRGTRRLRFPVGTESDAGPLAVELRKDGRLLARGRVGAPFGTGTIEARLDREIRRDLDRVRLCVRNRGTEPVNFGGAPYRPEARVGSTVQAGRMQAEMLLDEPVSAAALAPTIAHRFPLAKAGFMGAWTFWAYLSIMLAVWALVAAILVRMDRRE